MIWSLIKLVFGCLLLTIALLGNIFKWLFNFSWDKNLFVLFWTDKEANVQYYYNGNVIGWAFHVRRLADSAFDITKKEHIS